MTTSSFLDDMAASSRARAAAAEPEHALRAQIQALPPPPPLRTAPFFLIAELKRISPAAGPLDHHALPLEDRIRSYAAGGAAAISILTEPSRFGGSLEDLALAARSTALPVMRKDFLTHPIQLLEARAASAAGALLITRMLSDALLHDMLLAARDLNLFILLESFDRPDLDRSIAARDALPSSPTAPPILLGVNARDLATLRVTPHPDAFESLASCFPPDAIRVAESGVESTSDAHRLAALGYHAALVGSALMRATDPQTLCRELLAAAKSAQPHHS